MSTNKPSAALVTTAAAATPANGVAAPAKSAPQKTAPLHPHDDEHEGVDWSTLIPSVLTSTVFHIAVVLSLALYSTQETVKAEQVIVSTVTEAPPEVTDFDQEELPKTDRNDEEAVISDAPPEATPTDPSVPEIQTAPETTETDPAPTSDVTFETGDSIALPGPSGSAGTGKTIGGRTIVGRTPAAKAVGASDASEAAVERALKWLASVQAKDGGWNFDTRGINPAVTSPGTGDQARNAATAMALLPFLAAGHTHKVDKSPYQQVVYRGLDFLTQNVNKKYTNLQTGNVSWFETQGSMYSHGLAAMAMCEAYGMTKDKAILPFAQGGMNFISTSQDPAGGGWRYAPRQPGDTSVVGWQLMALKSGSLGYLNVKPNTIKGAINFLNTVSDEKDYRATYGYMGPGKGPAQTAIGLLCRMHLGWKKDHQGLITGVQYLSKMGPNKANFYYNYYATQVMFQWGGEEFDQWNSVMRDQLVKSQSTRGADVGSWDPIGNEHGVERGGRLYATSLATMILEVYYRYSKVLSKDAVDESFPL